MRFGNFGKKLIFQVDANKILTPSDMKHTVSGRWKSHGILGKKPKKEFAGPESDEVTLTIVLSAEHGIRPRATLETIETLIEKGTVEYLIIGGRKVGKNKMYIESVSEAWDCMYNRGELVKATASLTLSEY